MTTQFKIGNGFDAHRFGEGDHVMLGGVSIPFKQGLLAHSDGDVVLHAVCDAVLGAKVCHRRHFGVVQDGSQDLGAEQLPVDRLAVSAAVGLQIDQHLAQ